jgi:hypothetical protein
MRAASARISVAEASGGTPGDAGGLRSKPQGDIGGIACGWRLE